MAASKFSGSKSSLASSRLKIVSSCGEEVFCENSSVDNDLITSSTTSLLKRMAFVENESCPSSTMDHRGLWNMLNDDLIEKILARLPFKSLCGVSLLSKTWSQKLGNHSSFQREVLRSTSTWSFYCPIFANDKAELIGYERGSRRWHKLATQSDFSLPGKHQGSCRSLVNQKQRAWTWRLNLMAVSKSVVCWMWSTHDACECSNGSRRRAPFYPFYLYVSNPLTKSWKQLPPIPHMKVQGCPFCKCTYGDINVHVDCQGTNTYQVVVLIGQTNGNKMYVRIFDSGSGTWTMEKYKLERLKDGQSTSVYINGVIHMGIANSVGLLRQFSLLSFDLENKIWSHQNLSINQREHEHDDYSWWCSWCSHLEDLWRSPSLLKLVVCGSNIMFLVFHEKGSNSGWGNLCVYRLDLQFGSAFEVSTAPKDILDLFMKEVGDIKRWCAAGVGDSIYLSGTLRSCRSLMYNLTSQKWAWIPPVPNKFKPFPDPPCRLMPWTLTAYEPVLNPFMKV